MNRSTVRRRARPATLAAAAAVALCTACGGGAPESPFTLQPSATTATTTSSAPTAASTGTAPTTTSATGTTTATTTASTVAPSSTATPRNTTSAPTSATAASPSTRPETRSRTTTSSKTSPKTSATAAPAGCRPGQVRAVIAEDDSGAGQRYATLTLRNSGSTRCTVAAYPRLQLLTRSGAAVPTKVVPAGAGRPVTLRPDARATAQLHWSTVPGPGDPSADRCPPPASRLRVVPGGGAGAVTIGWDLGPVCSAGRIDAEPLRVP